MFPAAVKRLHVRSYIVWSLLCWLMLSYQVFTRKGVALQDLLTRWILAPTGAVSDSLVDVAFAWRSRWRSRRELLADNRRLTAAVQRYRHLELLYTQALEELHQLAPHITPVNPARQSFIAARVLIHDPLPAHRHEMIVNRGSRDGVDRFAAVVHAGNLVGYLVDVRRRTATVRLLTHPLFAVGAELQGSNYSGLIRGTGHHSQLELMYLPEGLIIPPGRLVLTSGLEGVLPPHLPIGYVTTVTANPEGAQVFLVAPRADLGAIRRVSIIITSGPHVDLERKR